MDTNKKGGKKKKKYSLNKANIKERNYKIEKK